MGYFVTTGYEMSKNQAAEIVREYDALGDELVDLGLAMIYGTKTPFEVRAEFKKKSKKYKEMKNDKFYADYVLAFSQ